MSSPSPPVMSRFVINPILAAVMAAFAGLVLHGCKFSDRAAIVKATCEFSVEKEVNAIKGTKLNELADKCKEQKEGAAQVVSEEEAIKVQNKCLGEGSRIIEEKTQEQYESHLAQCIEKGNAASNGTDAALSGLIGFIGDFVNNNKEQWGNQTGALLDNAVNVGLDKANELLEEEKKKAAEAKKEESGAEERLFTMQKVVTEVGSGSLLTMFSAALALLAIGSAVFFASLRARRAARQNYGVMEELQSTDNEL